MYSIVRLPTQHTNGAVVGWGVDGSLILILIIDSKKKVASIPVSIGWATFSLLLYCLFFLSTLSTTNGVNLAIRGTQFG